MQRIQHIVSRLLTRDCVTVNRCVETTNEVLVCMSWMALTCCPRIACSCSKYVYGRQMIPLAPDVSQQSSQIKSSCFFKGHGSFHLVTDTNKRLSGRVVPLNPATSPSESRL